MRGAGQIRNPAKARGPATDGVTVGALVTSEAGATLEEDAGGGGGGGAVMELVQEVRKLVSWAAEEMEAPEAARAPESTLRR